MFQGYTKLLSKSLILVFIAALCQPVLADDYKASSNNYEQMPDSLRDNPEVKLLQERNPNKVQVIMFFSYGCFGCGLFNPSWEQWAKNAPEGVKIDKYPLSWNRAWRQYAKAYYTMASVAPNKNMNTVLFDSLQKKHLNIANPSVLADIAAENGIDARHVKSTFQSFHVEHQVNNAAEISKVFEVSLSPTVVILGPSKIYKLTIGDNDNNPAKFVKTINYLAEQQVSRLKPSS